MITVVPLLYNATTSARLIIIRVDQLGSTIIIVYFKTHHAHTIFLQFIEGINSRCRRFDVLPFRHFDTFSRRYGRRCRRSGCRCLMSRRLPTATQLPPLFDGSLVGRWFIQINTHADDTVSVSFWVFFAYKKLLGRTETRTRERKDTQSIETV